MFKKYQRVVKHQVDWYSLSDVIKLEFSKVASINKSESYILINLIGCSLILKYGRDLPYVGKYFRAM